MGNPSGFLERLRARLLGKSLLFSSSEEGQAAPVTSPAVAEILRERGPGVSALGQLAPTVVGTEGAEEGVENRGPALPKVAPTLAEQIGSMAWTSEVEKPSATSGGKPEVVSETRPIPIREYQGFRGMSVSGADPSMTNPPPGTAAWTPALAGAAPTAWALKTGTYPGAPPGTYNPTTGTFTTRVQEEAAATKRGTALGLQDVAAERLAAPERQATDNMMAYTGALIASRNPEQMAKGFALRKMFTESLGKQIVIPKGGAVARGGTIEVVNPEIQQPGAKGGGGGNLPQGRESAVWRIAFNQAIVQGKTPLEAIGFADRVTNESIQSGAFARGTGRTEGGYGPAAQGLKAGTEEARKKVRKWGTR